MERTKPRMAAKTETTTDTKTNRTLVNQYGTSWIDQMGCVDDDGDGISSINDPDIATTNVEDWDGDGYLDHAADVSLNNPPFPLESTQWMDSDEMVSEIIRTV